MMSQDVQLHLVDVARGENDVFKRHTSNDSTIGMYTCIIHILL